MGSHILHQKEAIRLALSVDWSMSHLTDALSGEKYVTISAVIPIVELVMSKIVKVDSAADSQLIQSLKNLIKDNLSWRYTDDKVISLLDIMSVLDPRFKVQYVKKLMMF